MATTTNYGWTTPDNTDLVKDGALAIRTLGSAIDTSMNTALGTKKAGLVLLNTTSFSAVASQSINDVFSATYQNYLLVLNATTSATNPTTVGIRMRMRVSSTDASGANYDYAGIQRNDSAFSSFKTNGDTSTQVAYAGDRRTTAQIHLFSPNEAEATIINTLFTASGSANFLTGSVGSLHNVATAYTGFSLIPDSGTMTGNVRVYGINQ